MSYVSRFKQELSFLKGNYLILIATWLIMDIFNETPSSSLKLYALELGSRARGKGKMMPAPNHDFSEPESLS